MIPLRALAIAFKASPRAAFAALWASVRGLRVRARNIIFAAAHQEPSYYPVWASSIEPEKVEAYCQEPFSPEDLPQIAVLMFGSASAAKDACRTASSVRAAFQKPVPIFSQLERADSQIGSPDFGGGSLVDFLQDPQFLNAETWLLPIFAGDELAPWTGRAVARAFSESHASDIVYWDEDQLEGGGRRNPWLKPDWDELLFLSRDFLTGSALFKAQDLLASFADAKTSLTPQSISEAVIAMVSRAKGRPRANHIPLILSHRAPDSTFATALERKHFIASNWHEPVELNEISGVPETLRPQFSAHAELPKISILIPTRNQDDLLRSCVEGLSKTDYPGGIEIIIIDNESDDSATLEYLARLKDQGITVIRHPGPFNFSAMNNRAASLASGELLCLLNNDVEMHDGFWLQAMARHALRPSVGAVGALLQYPDGTVQHAGVTVGTGEAAGHVHRGVAVTDAGHRHMHRLTREVSAVTAACLVIRKETFLEVGGFDERSLKVAFNDVDLCLKLSRHGYRNVFAGEACLTHHESKSRGNDLSETNRQRYLAEVAYLQQTWGTKTFVDPYGHPLVMRSSEKFVLGP